VEKQVSCFQRNHWNDTWTCARHYPSSPTWLSFCGCVSFSSLFIEYHWMFLIHSCSVLQHISVRNENNCGLGLWTHAKHTAASMGLRGLEIGTHSENTEEFKSFREIWDQSLEHSHRVIAKFGGLHPIFCGWNMPFVTGQIHQTIAFTIPAGTSTTIELVATSWLGSCKCGQVMSSVKSRDFKGILEGQLNPSDFLDNYIHWIPSKGFRKP